MIQLMDHLMKQLNLDLHLTVYDIRAYSSDDGIMELVENSRTLQDVQEEYSAKDGLQGYFRDLTTERNKMRGSKSQGTQS